MSRWPLCLLNLALFVAGVSAASGQDAGPPLAAGVPPFHRTYIPADEIQKRSWPAGYLPVDAQEFQQLVETVRSGAQGAPVASAAIVERCEYQAKLEGDDLLVGALRLHLNSSTTSAKTLILDPCNLALTQPTWADQQGKPAVLGAGADRRVRVVVAGNELHAAWSLRGQRTASGVFGFRLQLPRSPMNRLSLELPPGLELVCEQGIVSKAADPEANTTRWVVELGGHHHVDLRLVPEESTRERRPLTLFRQTTAYEFTPRGVNVVVQLKLDVHGEPLQRIAVDIDPGLRLVAARFGELEIPWSITTQPETGGAQAILQLSEPIVDSGRVVQLSGIAPLQSGKRWRLPAMRPQGLSWQEGTAQILVPSLFLMEQLDTDGCRQSRLTALPAPLSGESIEVQYFRPSATLDVVISQPRERPVIDTASLVEVGVAEFTSRCALQLTLVRGQRRAVKIDIRPAWIIDSVENLDGTGNPTWEMEELSVGRPQLKISLATPLSADKPARLLVRGHRSAPVEPAFPAQELRMLAADSARPAKRLIAVRAIEGAELRWSGADAMNRLDVQALNPAELKLFPQPPGGQLFAEDDLFSQATLSLARRRPTYSVNIRVDAAVQQNQLTETYTIQCTPEAARVERLLVHLSQARTAGLEWSIAGGNAGEFSARRMSAAEQSQTGLPPAGEVWELNLQLAKPGAFELRGVRSVEFAAETPLALASVSDAVSQRGTVAIRALGQSGLTIRNRRLTLVPVELLDADRYQTARAAYHYQPGRDDLDGDSTLSVAPAPVSQSDTGAWAWRQRLESRYGQQDQAVHWSTFFMQTGGRQNIKVWLPGDAQLLSVWVDDRRLSVAPSGTDQALAIELPPGRSFVAISLSFSTPDRLPTLVGSYQAPFPRLDGPVMARQWTIWTPAGFSLFDGVGRIENNAGVPLTWSQRLFGVLGRSASQKIFNPLAPEDWKLPGAEAAAGRQTAQQFTASLGGFVLQYANAEALTWGQLLALASESEAQESRTLLVDVEGLESAGINPQTRVRSAASLDPAERGRSALAQSQLRLLACGNHLVVTGAASPVLTENVGRSHPREVTVAPAQGALADELRQATKSDLPARYQAVATWLATPPQPPNPWTAANSAPGSPQDAPNWIAQRLNYSSSGDPRIRICQRAAVGSLAWAVFLVVMGGGLWFQRWTTAALLSLLAASLLAALVLPAVYVPPASAAVLACLTCLAAQFVYFEPRRARSLDRSRSSRSARTSAIHQIARLPSFFSLIVLSWAVCSAQPAATSAQQKAPAPSTGSAAPLQSVEPTAAAQASDIPAADESEKPAPRRPIQRVFVPVDENQQPVGGKYFVSQELYSQLARQAATLSDQQNPWLLSQATYQASLVRDPASRRLSLAKLTARFELQVLRGGADVRLPLARGNRTNVLALRLEGRPLPIAWNEAGTELILGPLPVDRYRLELDLQPSIEADSTTAGFDVAIPSLPQATLELTFPPDSPTIELPGARGAVRVSQQRGELSADLGGADRLAIRWPVAIGMDVAAPNLEVDELLWVKVRPGTTLVDARFKYRVLSGSVRRIRLLTDPRLRLLPPTSAQSPIADVHTIPGEPQKVELELRRPVSDEVVVDLSFLVTNASGVGNLRLPRLETSGARTGKRLLAVSVDAALQPKIQAGEDSKTLDIAEFVAAWGAADTRPQAAFVVPRGEPVWVLATQPNEPRIASEQSLSLGLGRSHALVQFDAQLTITGGHSLQLGLQGPPGLAVEQVSVLEDQVQHVARWSVSDDGRITVFLSAPIDGRQRLSLRGRWNFATAAALSHPFVEILGADVKKRQLNLYRQPAVLVQIQSTPGVVPLEGEAGAPLDGFGSAVGRYQVENPTAELSLVLTPNAAHSRAVMATFVERDGDHWSAELDFHLHVQDGLVDSLQFDIPPQWSEPFRVDAPFKVVPVPGELRRQLIVFPAKPVSDTYQLRIRGRVAPSAGDRLRVPDIRPMGVNESERFIVLPQQRDRQQITWETLGLTSAKLPAELAPRRAGQSYLAYQATGESFQASLRAVERATALARVVLADVHVAWQRDGNFEAVAAFDVDPAGASSCVLALPQDCRLLRATIEGLPSQATEQGSGRWRLSFQSQQLPQCVEVIYTGPVTSAGHAKRFPAPRLEDLEVAQTLWTVDGPRDLGPGQPTGPSVASGAAQHEIGRLAAISALVKLPAEVVGEHLPEEIARWYRAWRSRYASSRIALRWNLTSMRQASAPSDAALEASQFDAQLEAVDSRLRGASGSDQVAAVAPSARQLLAMARSGAPRSYARVQGASAELMLAYPQAASDKPWLRWLAALSLLTALATAAYLLAGRALPTFAPWLVGGVIGLVAWLLWAPSALGLLALALACVLGIRARWQIGMRLPAG